MKKLLAVVLLLTSTCIWASPEMIAGVILGQVVHDLKEEQRTPPGQAVIAYPAPVYQPQVIVVPQCTPNGPCNAPLLQCDTLPIVDQYGRIIAYHKTCR